MERSGGPRTWAGRKFLKSFFSAGAAGVLLLAIMLGLLPGPAALAEGPRSSGSKEKEKAASERVFRAIYPRAPKSLDPHAAYDPAAWPVIMAAYDRLITLRNGTAEPTPALVETVRISPDGLQYTFVLNGNYTFADGRLLNSEAALFSFDRLMASEVGKRYYPYLKRFEILSDYNFRLILDRPWPPFLASLALPPASLVSPGLVQEPPNHLAAHSLGGGRFQVYDWRDGTIGLKARSDLLSRPGLDFIMYHYEPDPVRRYEKALEHSAHLTVEPAFPDGGALPPTYQKLAVKTFEARYLAFNTRRPYLARPGPRRAMGRLVSEAFKEHPGHFEGLFPPGLFYNAPRLEALPEEPLARSQAAIREAGSPGAPLKLIYRRGDLQAPAETALIAAALAGAGVPVEASDLDEAELTQALAGGDYDLFLDTRVPDIPSPDMWLGRFLDSTASADGNPARFNSLQADRLIDLISAAVGRTNDGPSEMAQVKRDQAARLADLADLAAREAPYVFLYSPERTMMIDLRLAGVGPHPQWPEVWPLDQVDLKPFSFRSGANPSGRPPAKAKGPGEARKKGELKISRTPEPIQKDSAAPGTPVKPRPPEAPAVSVPETGRPQEPPRMKFLEPGDFNEAPGPRNSRPGFDDFLGQEMD